MKNNRFDIEDNTDEDCHAIAAGIFMRHDIYAQSTCRVCNHELFFKGVHFSIILVSQIVFGSLMEERL